MSATPRAGGDAPGHRSVPHTADVAVEAWAPTLAECVVEAVAGVVATFAQPRSPSPAMVTFEVGAGAPADQLIAVLEELIYRVDVDGTVPIRTEVTELTRPTGPAGGALQVRWVMADPASVEVLGAVPKAVALHALAVEPTTTGWRCHVLLDV